MPKLDPPRAPVRTGSIYPAALPAQMAGRSSRRLGQAGGLTQFGVTLVTPEPGARSSLRHWHDPEDEFVMVTHGTLLLIDDAGETTMEAGACAAFPAGTPDGHCFVNRSDGTARFLVIGSRAAREGVTYPDNDLHLTIADGAAAFTGPDGAPYAAPA